MPWYPFFQKMAAVDTFVILGNCQFEKNNYQNRFQMDGVWNTMSVNGGSHDNIVDKRYVNHQQDWAKIKKRLFQCNTARFDQFISDNLYRTNVGIIREISAILGLRCEIVEDKPTASVGTGRIIEICKTFNATDYLSGTGASKYLTESAFSDNGIRLHVQDPDSMVRMPALEFLKEKGL
jgi:hypothetical protein